MRSQPNDYDLKRLVLRLDGFYMQVSFLGSIGHLITGSRLQALLEMIYARNTVTGMMTGKAVSRTVRGHGMLVDAALNTILIADAYNAPVPAKVQPRIHKWQLLILRQIM